MTVQQYFFRPHAAFLSVVLFCISLLQTCHAQEKYDNDSIEVYNQFNQLKNRIESDTQTTWVINFWATTCPPCLKEMPHFKELQNIYAEDPVKVLLVNLDETEDLQTRVLPYIKKYNIEPEVVMLSDINYNVWTDYMDKTWFGALPATLIMNDQGRNFKFGAYPTLHALEADLALVFRK